MLAEHVRDAAMTAAIFGFFASGWFGWAQEKPPLRWPPWLGVGSVLSLLTAAGGGVVAAQHWSEGSVFGPDASRRFGIVVGIEVVAALVGALVLMRSKRGELVAPWVALVVGAHFFPLAAILDIPLLHVVALLLVLGSFATPPYARRRGWTVSAVTGVWTGAVLLVAAVVSLLGALA